MPVRPAVPVSLFYVSGSNYIKAAAMPGQQDKDIFLFRDKGTVGRPVLSQRRESLVQRVVPARLFSGLAEIAGFC